MVVASTYGGVEALHSIEGPAAEPEATEVLVALKAIGVNQADVKSYHGTFGIDPSALPLSLGFEGAGVVQAVGSHIADYASDDEVIVYPASGTYATDICVPVDSLTPKPTTLPWDQAAGLMLTGVTAVHALTATGVSDHDVVLIHGGAGGVGHMAIQLAIARGASVIATAAARDHELVQSLGATPVVYGAGLLDRVHMLGSPTVSLDLVGSAEALDVSCQVTTPDRIATIANFGPQARAAGIKILGAGPGGEAGTEIRRAARAEIAQLAGIGSLRVHVAATYPLDKVAEAHTFLTSGLGAGKVILIPS